MKVCRHARTWIERSFAGSLGLKDQFLLEEHVIECEACRERWEESHSLLAALDRLPAAPEDQVDLERSLEAINAGINAGVGAMPASVAVGRRTLWISAAAALLLVLGSALWRSSAQPPVGEAALELQELSRPGAAELAALQEMGRDPWVVVYPALPELPQEDEPNPERQQAAQRELRGHLALAAHRHLADSAVDETAFLKAFEQGTQALRAGGWPLGTMTGGLLADPDPLVARAALRYLGLRPTVLGVERLTLTLAHPTLKFPAVLALADAGQLGARGLAKAFWDPDLTELVRGEVECRDQADQVALVEWVWQALDCAPRSRRLRTPDVETAASFLPGVLATCGDEGARALLSLRAEPLLREGLLVDCLSRTEGGEAILLEVLAEGVRDRDVGFFLAAVDHMLPPDAYAWVQQRAWHGGQRAAAASLLARFGGTRTIHDLLELAQTNRVDSEVATAAFTTVLKSDSGRAVDVAWEFVEHGDRTASRSYLNQLVFTGQRAAVDAILVLVGYAGLSDQVRERAMLLASELGDAGHLTELGRQFADCEDGEREQAAVCLFAIHRLGSTEATLSALAGAPPAASARVLQLLEEGQGAASPQTTLFKLTHELEPVFRARVHFNPRISQ